MQSTFGKRLTFAMQRARMRDADLASLCQVHRDTVRKWRKMREADLRAKHAVCAADVLDIDLRQLLLGTAKKGRGLRKLPIRIGKKRVKVTFP